MVAEAMGRRFRPRRGTVRPNLPFGACGLSVGEEQPSFPRAGGCGPGPHSLVWGVRVGRPRLLGRTALGRALASGRQSGLPTIRLAKAGYYWFEPFRAARAWRRRGLGVSRHGLSLFRGAARYTLLARVTLILPPQTPLSRDAATLPTMPASSVAESLE